MAELEKFSALYGKIDYPADLLTIPFEVLEYSDRLGLSASEFKFVCWIFHLTNKDFEKISDCNMTSKKTSFCRQRKSLQAKGYLKIKIARNYQKGKLISSGLVYDFTNIKNKIEELKEEDKKLQNLEAPVTVIYDEPSLFNDDVSTEPLQPPKLIKEEKEKSEKEKTSEEKEEDKKQEEFLEKYNELHKELIGVKINHKYHQVYTSFLIDIFKKRVHDNFDEALSIVKFNFLKLSLNKRYSLKLQDLLRMALCQKNENPKNNYSKENKTQEDNKKYSIPRGLDKLNYLLNELEKGGNINEAYAKIADCG